MSFSDQMQNVLFGTPYAGKKYSTFMPGQEDLANNLFGQLQQGGIFGEGNQAFGQGLGYLSDLYSGDPNTQNRLSAPYERQFSEQTVPELANRFSGAGYGGVNSSAFNQSLGQAGGRLSENLGAMFEGLKSQNLSALQGLSAMPGQQAQQALQQKGFQQQVTQPGEGLLGSLLGALGQGIGGGAGGGSMLMSLLKKFIGGFGQQGQG